MFGDTRKLAVFAVLVALLLVPAVVQAQEGPENDEFSVKYWGYGGFGTGIHTSESTDAGIDASLGHDLGVTLQPLKSLVLTARWGAASEFCFDTLCDEVNDFGLMAGWVAADSDFYAAFSAGPALVMNTRAGGDLVETVGTFGLALDTHVYYNVFPFWAIGLSVPMNFNAERSFSMFVISFRTGKLW